MRLCSLCLWSYLHSLRSPKVRLLLSAIIAGKADEPFCGIVVHRTRPLTFIIDHGVVFPGFPFFRSCFPGYPGLPKESASLRSIFCLVPFLGAPLYYHKAPGLSSAFLSFCAFIFRFSRRLCRILRMYFVTFAYSEQLSPRTNLTFRTTPNIAPQNKRECSVIWNIPSNPGFKRSGRYPAG